LIIEEKKLIFIHIPKCAGTSIENLLINRFNLKNHKQFKKYIFTKRIGFKFNLRHLTLEEIEKEYSIKNFDQYTVFTIVRNPYDRFISFTNWAKVPNWRYLPGISFSPEIWMKIFNIKYPWRYSIIFNFLHEHTKPQSSFLKSENFHKYKEIKIVKLDQINELSEFLKAFDIDLSELSKDNISKKKVLSRSTKEKIKIFVESQYSEDFKRFNFDL
tara:strand:+ start:430 stop:1074 length:645 start_codon:yes stop_codon:yes gene_type:complete